MLDRCVTTFARGQELAVGSPLPSATALKGRF